LRPPPPQTTVGCWSWGKDRRRGGDLRRCSTQHHPLYCGLDLPARPMDVCLLRQDGAGVRHRQMPARPDAVLKAIAPSRDAMVVAVAWILPWYGLADLGAPDGLPVVLGPALSLQALHGGTATNDPIDSQNLAGLLRGGLLPQASGSPAARRATRDLRRRRRPLTRQRAELRAHLPHTTSPYPLAALGTPLASKAQRDGVAARCLAPAVPPRGEGD